MKWFKHKTNMRHDIKLKRVISKYGLEGYGLYNLIIESIVESLETDSPLPILQDNVDDIADFYNANSAKVQEMTQFMVKQGLFDFTNNNEVVCIKVYKHLQSSQTRSEQIRRLISSYNKESPKLSQAVSDNCEEETTQDNTTQEEKRIDYTVTDSIIDYYNEITSQKRKHSKTSREPIHARLCDYSIDDCKHVINVKYAEWKDDPKMSQYITIETFFRPSNFEKYLNQKIVEKKTGSTPTKEEIKNKDYKAGWND